MPSATAIVMTTQTANRARYGCCAPNSFETRVLQRRQSNRSKNYLNSATRQGSG